MCTRNEQEKLADSGWRQRLWRCFWSSLHIQAACPQKGPRQQGTRRRNGAAEESHKNRVPVLLAAVIGRAMLIGRQRSEERAEKANHKRKR